MNEDIEIKKGLRFDFPNYYIEQTLFIPKIQEQGLLQEGFNTVFLKLDGTTSSHLDWKAIKEQALEFIEKGFKIFWDLDLGLFNSLKRPLSNQTQYLSLELSLKHFKDFIWKDLGDHSLGVCLYKGNGELGTEEILEDIHKNNFDEWSQGKNFSLEHLKILYRQHLCLEYHQLLTHSMPDEIPMFLLMDTSHLSHPVLEPLLTHPDIFDRLNIILHSHLIPPRTLSWNQPSPYGFIGCSQSEITSCSNSIAVCLPLYSQINETLVEKLSQLLETLKADAVSFRVIPEQSLISEWDELSELIVFSKALSSQGLRKLKGFNAAGGTIIFVDEPLALEPEVSFREWKRKLSQK